MILSAQSIRKRCLDTDTPMISPFVGEKVVQNGKSYGLSACSYDVRIDHDLILGVNPAFILSKRHTLDWSKRDISWELRCNAPVQSLAYTVEDFNMPHDVAGFVVDKSSYARVFVTAFNTLLDPGFIGNLTLELVNLGAEPVEYRKGDPVCQIVFHLLDEATDRPYRGKYQHQTKAAHPARFETTQELP